MKILDFGVARLGEGMTHTGRIVGTPHYMSPEQIRADRVDGRSDLFSTALMFYELVTGVKAYRPGSAVTVMFQIVHEDPDLSRLPRTAVGAALGTVLRRALARDREQRYPDAAALTAALSAAIDTPEIVLTPADEATPETVPATGSVRPASSWALGAAPPRSEPPPVESARAAPTRPAIGLWIGAVAAAVVLVAGLAAWWWARIPGRPIELSPEPIADSPPPSQTPVDTVPTPAMVPRPVESAVPAAPSSALASPMPSAAAHAAPLLPTAVPPPSPSLRAPVETRVAVPVDPQERLARANRLFEAGQLGAALAEVRAVLRAQPDNTEAKYLADDIELDLAVELHLKAARAALARGDRETARREADAGLKLKPNESRLGALLRELDPP